MTDQYAVIGNPIEHSKSPYIHRRFAELTNQDLEYGKILGDLEHFAGDVRDFFGSGGRGMNVTVPFKEQAWRLADELGSEAHTAGAVNTLSVLDDGRVRGDNTDGLGLVRDLEQNQGLDISGKRVLLLGAGGASKGVARPLLERNPRILVIANRTAERARDLADQLQNFGLVAGCGLNDLHDERFDLIINGTAAGLAGEVPHIPRTCFGKGAWAYDMMYAAEPTAFV
jgi:shikimate dehydrogenase